MFKRFRIPLFALLFAAIGLFFVVLTKGSTLAVLSPQGHIAAQEKHLMIVATLLMLIVVVPVFVLTAAIAWRYRADNAKATYSPEWDSNPWLEFIWWGLPCLIILAIGTLIWNSSHDLDPYKPLDSAVKPVTIQVVALRWKWLFIYPEQGVASVNYVQFPEDTPVNFVITSDAPMNSFWIPQLGGQVYAMPGMSTKLHLIADHTGDYAGSSANLSGAGFASMKFRARSTSSSDFDEWVRTIKQSDSLLTADNYANDLAMPSQNNPVEYYMLGDDNLYESALGKSMMHGSATEEHQSTNIQ